MAAIRIAIVGLGKIAHDQHIPSIAGNPDLELVATVSPRAAALPDIPNFHSLDDLLASEVTIDAVALCTPPQVRRALASQALAAGLHVFLEKPPGATLAEVAALDAQASAARVTLFASWHSRFAPGVEPARAWLAERQIEKVSIIWREDVRVWHPGQAWIWQPGGLGVFDPGINALSIATAILPRPLFVKSATLSVPANCATPIAARIELRDEHDTPVSADFDFRQTGPQSWDIVVETDGGTLTLAKGGAVLTTPDGVVEQPEREYPGLYARFAALVRDGRSEVDVAPLRLVADAFLSGRIELVEPFED